MSGSDPFICLSPGSSGPITVDADLVCNFVEDCYDGSDELFCGDCKFENNTGCGWYDTSLGQYKWILTKGMTKNQLLHYPCIIIKLLYLP